MGPSEEPLRRALSGVHLLVVLILAAVVLMPSGASRTGASPPPDPVQAVRPPAATPRALPVGLWTNASPVSHPGPLGSAVMAYSPDADRILLVGSNSSGEQTWLYDVSANRWTEVPNGTSSPGSRRGAALAYDAAIRRFILFGGYHYDPVSGGLWTNDTWLFDPATEIWTDVSPVVSPSGREASAMTYVPDTGQVLLFGGIGLSGPYTTSFNDTWLYDAVTNTWRDVSPAASPRGDFAPHLTYDPETRTVFGGVSTTGEFWEYDPFRNAWQQLTGYSSVVPSLGFAMAYDAAARTVVLFGGSTPTGPSNGTWWFNRTTSSWSSVVSLAAPPARSGPAGAYDSLARLFVLFGGADSGTVYDDTWLYRPTTPPALTVSVSVSSLSGPAPLLVAFRGIPHGGRAPFTYRWDFGDGSYALIASPMHAFSDPGTYEVTLIVTDAFENSTTASVQVIVGPGVHGGPVIPLASAVPWAVVLVAAVGGVAAAVTYAWLRPRTRPRQ